VNPVFSVRTIRSSCFTFFLAFRTSSNRGDTYIETLNTKLAEQLEKLVSTKSTKNEKENTELAITSNIHTHNSCQYS
jgi:hypothetical protein